MSALETKLVLALYGWAASGPLPRLIAITAAKWLAFVAPVLLAAAWWWPYQAPGPDSGATRRALVVSATSALLGGLVVLVLAAVLDRARPFVALGLVPLFPHGVDSSFPSDHTMLGAALAAPLVWERSRLRVLGALLFLVALLAGMARVAAGVHWPTDIAGTALLALACGAIARPITMGAFRRLPARWLAVCRLGPLVAEPAG